MLQEILEVSIGKEHTRADWSRRPLADAVLRYALDDVRYLQSAWRALEGRLTAAGRLAWLEEDCERTLLLPIQADPATILERTKGAAALQGKQRSAAQALIAWREIRAQQRNRPRRWILADEPLVQIATALPQTLSELQQIPDLPPKLIAGAGPALLAAIECATPLPELARTEAPDKALVKQLQADVRQRAEALGIPAEMLATRKEIALAASGQLPAAFANGWRGAVLSGLFPGLNRDLAS
jgi:ribonuclease D